MCRCVFPGLTECHMPLWSLRAGGWEAPLLDSSLRVAINVGALVPGLVISPVNLSLLCSKTWAASSAN